MMPIRNREMSLNAVIGTCQSAKHTRISTQHTKYINLNEEHLWYKSHNAYVKLRELLLQLEDNAVGENEIVYYSLYW